jgi:hypothetical protein
MAFIRTIKKENPFVQLDKFFIEDPVLSWKAKGLLSYFLSRPNDWKINYKDLIKKATDGKDAVTSCLKELQKRGYINYYQKRDENGLFGEWVYDVYERPEYNPVFIIEMAKPDPEKPHTEKPHTEKPHTEKPDPENPDYTNNKRTNIDLTNNKTTNNKLNNNQSSIIELLNTLDISDKVKSYLFKKLDDLTIDNLIAIENIYLTNPLPDGEFNLVLGDVLAKKDKVKNLELYLRRAIKNYINEQPEKLPETQIKVARVPKWLEEENKRKEKAYSGKNFGF